MSNNNYWFLNDSFNNKKQSKREFKKFIQKEIKKAEENNKKIWGIKKIIVLYIFYGFAKTNYANDKLMFELKYKIIQKIMKDEYNLTVSKDHLNTIMNELKQNDLIKRVKNNRENKYYIILTQKMIDILYDVNKQSILNHEKKKFKNLWWETIKVFCKRIKTLFQKMIIEIKEELKNSTNELENDYWLPEFK